MENESRVMFFRHLRIGTPVRFENVLIELQCKNEFKDRRLVMGKPRVADAGCVHRTRI